jgi:hypothetical protein
MHGARMADFSGISTWCFGHVYCTFSIFWMQARLADVIKRYRFYKKPLID